MKTVCKGCACRCLACWGTCEKFKAAKAKHDRIKKTRQEHKRNSEIINSVQYYGLKQARKARGTK